MDHIDFEIPVIMGNGSRVVLTHQVFYTYNYI